MKPSFSTVACLDWPLDRVCEIAESAGYLGVELRTFGSGSTECACDPALTDPSKFRAMLDRSGAEPVCLATSVRFDAPHPTGPIHQALGDLEQSVRQCKFAIDLAAELHCPFVRVFGFEIGAHERRASALERITDRLGKSLDHARNSGVRLVIENGGSFGTATALAELIDMAASPMLGAAYNIAVAAAEGENPINGLNVLGERLLTVKLKDYLHGRPCGLGRGDVITRPVVEQLARGGFAGPVIFEYDRCWFPDLGDPTAVLRDASRSMYEWIGAATPGRRPGRTLLAV
ncbi:MAG: sugar phosphate isomerase/epimerase [Phycisphaerales bacterium]|nr:sugar phosphate isomerase/epimerase [Phycisphaerales bacterium]